MWLVLGFGGMGLLIGNMVAMTSEKVVTPVVGLLFAFIGTSILAVLHKLNSADRVIAGKAILSLSACCLLGIYVGFFVTEHQLLTPKDHRGAVAAKAESEKTSLTAEGDDKYLRSGVMDRANAIDLLKAQGKLTAEEAYDQMYRLARESASPGRGDR